MNLQVRIVQIIFHINAKNIPIIAVVRNMFRLSDLATKEYAMRNMLNYNKYDNRYVIVFILKILFFTE